MKRTTAFAAAGALLLTVAGGISALAVIDPPADDNPPVVIQYVDEAGNPITDPARAHEGYLMPIGGYKGSGLNIAIGLLAGVMNGAAFGDSVIDHRVELSTPTNTGQAIFVLRSDLFMPAEQMQESIAAHLDALRHSGVVRALGHH